GIRYDLVTGVQTCALPICPSGRAEPDREDRVLDGGGRATDDSRHHARPFPSPVLPGLSIDRGSAAGGLDALRHGEVRAGLRNLRHSVANADPAAGAARA